MGRRAKDRHYKGPAKLADPGGEPAPKPKLPKGYKAAHDPPKAKTLISRIKEILNERSLKDGTPNTRFDDCAEAFVVAMEAGSFIHVKEFIDRELGKVPQRIGDPDGKPLKLYAGIPLDGDDAP